MCLQNAFVNSELQLSAFNSPCQFNEGKNQDLSWEFGFPKGTCNLSPPGKMPFITFMKIY